MRSLIQKRFQLQLLFALIAAVSASALAVVLVLNAVRHAEGFVLADTNRTLEQAIKELQREYRLQLRENTAWTELPAGAQDVTLRAISQTVLNSYPGVEGGFWTHSRFLGYSFPTHDGGSPKVDVPEAERMAIEDVITHSHGSGKSERVLRGKRDLVVISADSSNGAAAWAMKRLPGQAESTEASRNFLLVVLVATAFLGVAGVLATAIGIHRGVAQIKRSLAAVGQNFVPGLPERRDELGEISVAINEMATARRRLEAELRREDRARTVGRLVGRIAHEMRNPLNSIRLSLQMLAQRQEENRLKTADFQIVLEEVDRMNRLLSDLLLFQQPRPPRTELLPVAGILHECARLLQPQAGKRGVEVVVTATPEDTALVDEQYFRQIVINLLLNAIEASAPGSRIEIHARLEDGRFAVRVSDHGPGLTPEQQEHLFEPFYTTKPDGHGLGLAVSRELAQSMGGNLVFQNGRKDGADFILSLKGSHGT